MSLISFMSSLPPYVPLQPADPASYSVVYHQARQVASADNRYDELLLGGGTGGGGYTSNDVQMTIPFDLVFDDELKLACPRACRRCVREYTQPGRTILLHSRAHREHGGVICASIGTNVGDGVDTRSRTVPISEQDRNVLNEMDRPILCSMDIFCNPH